MKSIDFFGVGNYMMNLKRMIFVLILTLALSSSLKAFQNSEWVKFSPEGGGFTVLMPAPPQPADVKPIDNFVFHMFMVTIGREVYAVSYGDYAPAIRLDPRGELEANRDKFLRSLNAALTDSKNIELAGRPGLEFTGESAEYYFKSRVYFLGNRVHQIAVAFPKTQIDPAKIGRFFSSFAFTNPSGQHNP
jgi:hypothetical protein